MVVVIIIYSKYYTVVYFPQKILEKLGVEKSGRYQSTSFKVLHYDPLWHTFLHSGFWEDTDQLHSKFCIMGHISPFWVLNHSYEAGFIWNEPKITSYKPQKLSDTFQTVWQVFTFSILCGSHCRPSPSTTRSCKVYATGYTEVRNKWYRMDFNCKSYWCYQ